jgi:protein gp37
MKNSKIQWTDATWNIARGCTKVDDDCKFCYMYRESLKGTRYEPKEIVRTKTVFNLPLKIKEPSKIFTSSLTDFFHEDIDSYRDEAWDIIKKCPHHTFQILTKRPERLDYKFGLFPSDHYFGNVWLGTSVGSRKSATRIFDLINAKTPVKLKFLSIEPFHDGPINIMGYLNRINWVIVGGESGNENGMYRYRECKLEWIESIIQQCKSAGVPVFVKQLGTYLAKQLNLNDRHGGDINEWPEYLKVREFPKETP